MPGWQIVSAVSGRTISMSDLLDQVIEVEAFRLSERSVQNADGSSEPQGLVCRSDVTPLPIYLHLREMVGETASDRSRARDAQLNTNFNVKVLRETREKDGFVCSQRVLWKQDRLALAEAIAAEGPQPGTVSKVTVHGARVELQEGFHGILPAHDLAEGDHVIVRITKAGPRRLTIEASN
jgi:hypothetical protein